MEIRRAGELLQTALAQQASYSHKIHSTPRPSRSYSRHIDEPTVSSSGRNCNPPRGQNLVGGGVNAQDIVDQGRMRREAEQAAQYAARQHSPDRPTTSVETGVTFRTLGVPCLVAALRNVRLPKDFKGPVRCPTTQPTYPPETWVESYEMAMELLDVDVAACAKYFTMMLEGTTHT